jgi:cytochrome c oxidase subunit II
VGLAHFRMKMDAVPGMPTTMWFTPKYTTRQMREKYGPDFNYEISCDQMCGKGHFSMRGTIVVESQAEYNIWLASKQPQYQVAQGGAATPAGASPAAPNATDTTAASAGSARTMK